jgi:hypothetical protein
MNLSNGIRAIAATPMPASTVIQCVRVREGIKERSSGIVAWKLHPEGHRQEGKQRGHFPPAQGQARRGGYDPAGATRSKRLSGSGGIDLRLRRLTIPPPFANPLSPRPHKPSVPASNALLATRPCENAALRRCYGPSHETHHPCLDGADHLGQLGVDGPVSQNPPQTPIRRGNHGSALPLARSGCDEERATILAE